MRFLFLLFFTVPLLLARENPFAAATELEKTSTTKQTTTPPKTKAVAKPKIHPQRQQTKPEAIVVQKKKPSIHPQRRGFHKEVVNYSKARFVVRENSVYIETKDKVIRHFSIPNPPSIVIDFKSYSDFASKRKVLSTKPFIKLEMGAHNDRYRVVLRLDKMYQYKLDKRKYGQVVMILD